MAEGEEYYLVDSNKNGTHKIMLLMLDVPQ